MLIRIGSKTPTDSTYGAIQLCHKYSNLRFPQKYLSKKLNMSHYTISPLKINNISVFYDLYRINGDKSMDTLEITEFWQFGRGFIAEDAQNLGYSDEVTFYATIDEGENQGCDFQGSDSVYFEFSASVHIDEQEEFKHNYYHGDEDGRGGIGYIQEGLHNWQIEDIQVRIIPPVKVELCNEDGDVIRKVKLFSWEEAQKLRSTLGVGYVIVSDSQIKPEKID
jgi:hypothetical protein